MTMEKGPAGTQAGNPRPASGWELRKWLFMRFSGLALIFLALGHLFIMHIQNNVEVVDYSFVAWRMSFLVWRIYDAALLSLALFHGAVGVGVILDDMMPSPALRTWSVRILYGICWVVGIIGLIVLLTFQPKI